MVHLTTDQLVAGLVLAVVWAILGYLLAEGAKRKRGRTPWGLPSWVWALLWFLSVVIGLVLYLFAQYFDARKAQRAGASWPGRSAGAPADAAPVPGSQFPAYPRPANSGGDELAGPAEPAYPHLPPPPAWYPDPSGRFHVRWWDGAEWTTQVSTGGDHFVDTSPDQRIGPYRVLPSGPTVYNSGEAPDGRPGTGEGE